MRKPDFFIVGAPKSGTTAMNHYLAQHPDIYMAQKELHYFGRDLTPSTQVRDRMTYLSYFADARDEKRVGEASVWYLYSRSAAQEIHAFDASADIIIMLRNPVDMLYSQHSQLYYNGNEDIKDFAAALAAEEDRKRGKRIPTSAHLPEALFYRDTVRYTKQVKRYLDTFGHEKVYIILYEDFRRDPQAIYNATLEFLQVEAFNPEYQIVNANKRIVIRALHDFLWRPPKVVKKTVRRILPRAQRATLVDTIKRLNIRHAPRPPMDPALRARLQKEFEPEVARLAQLLDRDLSHWMGS